MADGEDSFENEYDRTTRNEDQEVLVQEIEEHKEMVSFIYPHATVSYDILGLLEENNRTLEDDDYWKFMGPPIDDSSRPSSIVSEPSNYMYFK